MRLVVPSNIKVPVVLRDWLVEYDNGFPVQIQGRISNGYVMNFGPGDSIRLNNIHSLDLGSGVVCDGEDNTFRLVGPGQQMIVLPHPARPYDQIAATDSFVSGDDDGEEEEDE